MFDFFADLLSWFYDLWPSYGGTIILFTLLIMAVMAPITYRQTRSMIAMQRLQPEVKRIRDKYSDDRDRMNQEMMALYQANGVNPLGGCLPILIQMPVFLVLFRIVQGLTRRVSDIGLATGDAATRTGNIGDRSAVAVSEFPDRTFNPEFLDNSSALASDLSATTTMDWLGMDLSRSPSAALGDGIITALPYLFMVLLVGVSSWLQQRQIQGRSNNANINPQQQMIMKVLPFMLPIFSFTFPAALVLYFVVSNVFRVGQQMWITKRLYGGDDGEPEIVRPEPAKKQDAAAASARGNNARGAAAGASGVNHGSRRPVTNPPKKRKKKPEPEPTKSGRPRKGKIEQKSEPAPRQHSKRVTPKKSNQDDAPSGARRRNKKR